MNLSIVVNVAIGLILVYLVLSLVASEIQELITTLFEWRAKQLKEAIANILGENTPEGQLTQKLYQNPLVDSLNQKSKDRKTSKGPSYIPSIAFAAALLEILRDISSKTPETIEEFIDNINNSSLPVSLKKNLLLFARRAQSKFQEKNQQIQELQKEIELWFDSSMERVSGVYKRNAKAVAFLIGFAIAIVVNADTVYIISSLSKEQTLTSTINQVATQVVTSNSESISCLQTAEDGVNKENCLKNISNDVNLALDNISPLPIGWDLSEPFQKQFSPFSLKNIVEVTIGWLITAVAISMGAPFWFGLLTKLINVRNAGNKPRARD